WNADQRPFKMQFMTVTEFGRLLEEKHASAIGTQRGDWTDHWTDGPASSAVETGINRTTHELLGMSEALESWLRSTGAGTWDSPFAAKVYENATLYDEHTWGAYSSVEAPSSLFTRAVWNRKSGFAYSAAMEAHGMVARAASTLAAPLGTKGPEGVFNLGDLEPEEAFKPSGIDEVLVINTLPWERKVIVEEPEPRGGAAPVGILDCFFNRGSGWGGHRPIPAVKRVAGTVPPMGFAFLDVKDGVPSDDLRAEANVIENAHYRVEVDPSTGGLLAFVDKALGHDFAGDHQGWRPGQYIYETVDSPDDRLAIANIDFDHPDFFVGRKDTPWVREIATSVELADATINEGRASIAVTIAAPGVHTAKVVYSLDAATRSLNVDWTLDKIDNPKSEAVFIAFPFALEGQTFKLDLNGIPATPNTDQLDGAAKDWYPVGRWVDVSDDQRGVTIVPLDAPLVHLGGITTGKWARTLEPESPTIMSWALNNHWLVNFQASQSGEIPLRYRLTTHSGEVDPVAATRYAAEAAAPPIVLRDIAPTGETRSSFFAIDPDLPITVTSKPGEDDGWIALRLQNLSHQGVTGRVDFATAPIEARAADPVEQPTEPPNEPLALADGQLSVALNSLEIRTVLVRFGASA
ncbi:MAG: hypothetical protein GY798_14525, partial [Hyphomicrobiales bacterium]|nr:hypothetical protein [Hyphomicrobiales bacterium]